MSEFDSDREPKPGRLARQMELALDRWRNETRHPTPTQSECHLAKAFGEFRPCNLDCVFLHVPSREGCIVERWEPGVQNNRELAAWFIAMRTRLEA